MSVKLNTKEKFYSIEVKEDSLDANMTANIVNFCKKQMASAPYNVILNLENVRSVYRGFGKNLFELQNYFYDHNHSFVICCITNPIKEFLSASNYWDILNHTLTESEAWDILQMEEIERDFLKEED